MSIWQYTDAGLLDQGLCLSRKCAFCRSNLTTVHDHIRKGSYASLGFLQRVRACPSCGWWTAIVAWSDGDEKGHSVGWSAGTAILREIDVSSEATPLEELRQYLTAKFTDRFKVHPRAFEALARGRIFRNRIQGNYNCIQRG